MSTVNFEQYRHPKWQKRRLERLALANWCCEACRNANEILNVHHKRYVKGRCVWEYEDFELEVLCETCHKKTHASPDLLSDVVLRIPREDREKVAHLIATYLGDNIIVGMEGRFQDIPELHAGFVARSVSRHSGAIVDHIGAAIDSAGRELEAPIPDDHMLAIAVIHVDPEERHK